MRSYGYKKKRGIKDRYVHPQNVTEITGHFDGACYPPPSSEAACGAIIKRKGQVVAKLSKYLGNVNTSCNLAEYEGLILILEWLIENKVEYANIFGDSKLVVFQMMGQWKARVNKPMPYIASYQRACELRAKLPNVKYYWLPRYMNEDADYQSRVPLIDRARPSEDAGFERAIEGVGRPNIRVIKKFKKQAGEI